METSHDDIVPACRWGMACGKGRRASYDLPIGFHRLGGGVRRWVSLTMCLWFPLLRGQLELVVFLVFQGVQGALPVLVVAVATLDAGLVEHCGHGGPPRVWSALCRHCSPEGRVGGGLTAD